MTERDVITFLPAFARAAALLHSAPLVGDRGIPRRVRVAAAALMALAVTPGRELLDMRSFWLAVPAEILFGLEIGLLARVTLAGAEAGGQLLGLNLELGFAGTFDHNQQEEMLTTRRFGFCIAGLAFLGAGGLESLVRALAVAAPEARGFALLTENLFTRSGQVLTVGLRVVAPTLLAAVISNLAVALTSRAAPAVNIFSVMLAFVLGSGLLVLIATAPSYVHETLRIGRAAAQIPELAP